MKISADPWNSQDYRSNFHRAKITLDGVPVSCFEADSIAGEVKAFLKNSDGSIQMSDKFNPAFEMLRGAVIINVAPMASEKPCKLDMIRQTHWWKKLLID